jgi:large subunit ribosomal protein L4
MSKVSLYNQQGEITGEISLPKEIFDLKMSADLVHQVAISQMGNRRQVIASTKGRGDVSGGGKKPWRQKGTGRARAGSSRSPLWRHGGVTFGPRSEVVFKKNIPSKMKRAALFMALSDKVKNNFLVVLDDIKLEKPKTKLMVGVLGKLPSKGETALMALPSMQKDLIASGRNINNLAVLQAKDLNCLDVLTFKYLIMPEASIKVIKETFAK